MLLFVVYNGIPRRESRAFRIVRDAKAFAGTPGNLFVLRRIERVCEGLEGLRRGVIL